MEEKQGLIVCGVDDAGRGSVLGPLVIAGVSIDRSKLIVLSKIGVRDSKLLSPKKRKLLYKQIVSLVDNYHVVKISPKLIDRKVRKNQLNDLEAKYMARVISKLKPDSSYVDSCDVNPIRFGKKVSKLAQHGKIYSRHHADSKYPIVSAASIIAKVTRDKEIEKLRKVHDLGSGYPSDWKTMKFLKNWIFVNKNPPDFARSSWKPIRIILNQN